MCRDYFYWWACGCRGTQIVVTWICDANNTIISLELNPHLTGKERATRKCSAISECLQQRRSDMEHVKVNWKCQMCDDRGQELQGLFARMDFRESPEAAMSDVDE
jgi:hypothetical protein